MLTLISVFTGCVILLNHVNTNEDTVEIPSALALFAHNSSFKPQNNFSAEAERQLFCIVGREYENFKGYIYMLVNACQPFTNMDDVSTVCILYSSIKRPIGMLTVISFLLLNIMCAAQVQRS